MRLLGTAFLILACAALALAAGTAVPSWQGKAESAFVPHGKVRLELGPGGYTIRPGADDKIKITYSADSESDLRQAGATISVSGSTAKVAVHGPQLHFQATIELPARSDLVVRLDAGNLDVEEIRGNKDIESHAGNLEIDVGSPDDYNLVDASVYTGNLDAPAFHVSKSGLFRSFHTTGSGEFQLHAHVAAGNLKLSSGASARPSFQ